MNLCVHGTRYRCVLRYTSVAALDPLAEFILDRVIRRSPGGQRIDRLVRSFGLSERIIEEVLADLVRVGAARLDLRGGRVVASGADISLGAISDDRGVLDVWQDHSSGAILPASWLSPYRRELPDAKTLRPLPNELFPGFLDAADAHLITFLTRADPSLRYRDGGEWRLDRLIHRTRLETQAAWFPVATVAIGDRVGGYVMAPEIPAWVTREWTSALQLAGTIDGSGAAPHGSSADGGPSALNPLRHAQLATHVGPWAERARDLFASVPPPRSLQEMVSLTQAQDVLQERLLSLCHTGLVALSRDTDVAHAPLAAKRSMIFVLNRLTDDWIEQICSAVGGRGGKLTIEIFVAETPAPAARRRCEGPDIRAEISETICLAGDFVVIDNETIILGPAADRPWRFPAVTIRGHDVVSAVLGQIQSSVTTGRYLAAATGEAFGVIHELLTQARFEDVAGSSAKDVLGQLRELRRQIVMAMHERKLEDRPPSPAIRNDSTTADGRVRAVHEQSRVSLGESHPALVQLFDSTLATLKMRLGNGHSPFAYVDGAEQHDALSWVAAEKPSAGDDRLRVFSNVGDADSVALENIRTKMEGAVKNGWRIEVFYPANNTSSDGLQRVRAAIGALARFTPAEHLPCGAIVGNDFVMCGTYHLLRDYKRARNAPATFLIVQQSVALASELTSAVTR